MSKSYLNTINLSDTPQLITKKISTMFTDPKRIRLSDKGHPETCNVFSYYSTFVSKMNDEVRDWCMNAKVGCTECKKILAENIINKIAPIQKKREELGKDKGRIRKILDAGRSRHFPQKDL